MPFYTATFSRRLEAVSSNTLLGFLAVSNVAGLGLVTVHAQSIEVIGWLIEDFPGDEGLGGWRQQGG